MQRPRPHPRAAHAARSLQAPPAHPAVVVRSTPNAQPPADTAAASASFSVAYHTEYGHHIAIVGSHPALGTWSVHAAAPLAWSEGDVWVGGVDLWAASSSLEYKYVLRDADGRVLRWGPDGDNFTLDVEGGAGAAIEIVDSWCGGVHDVAATTPPAPPLSPAAAAADLAAAVTAATAALDEGGVGPASREALAADAAVAAAAAAAAAAAGVSEDAASAAGLLEG